MRRPVYIFRHHLQRLYFVLIAVNANTVLYSKLDHYTVPCKVACGYYFRIRYCVHDFYGHNFLPINMDVCGVQSINENLQI